MGKVHATSHVAQTVTSLHPPDPVTCATSSLDLQIKPCNVYILKIRSYLSSCVGLSVIAVV